MPTLVFDGIYRVGLHLMFHLDNGVVAHHGFDDLHRVVDTDDLARLGDDAVHLRLDDLYPWVGRLCYGGIRCIDQLLVFLDHILLPYFLESVVGAFQQVGQHLLDGFVGAGITLDVDLAQLGFAEGHVELVVGEEFLQSLVEGARLHRERYQRVERLGQRALRQGHGQKQQEGYDEFRAFHIQFHSK